MARHDENKDVRLVSRIAKVNTVEKTIKASKSTLIGIKTWGRIDFLTNYCDYTFIWDNSAGVGIAANDSDASFKRTKKQKKEHQLTDKTKRNKRKNND